MTTLAGKSLRQTTSRAAAAAEETWSLISVLRDGFRQVVDDTEENRMAVRKVTAQAISKEQCFRSWNFLKLQPQDKGKVHLPASTQLPQPSSALANGKQRFTAKAVVVSYSCRS
ncbi:hypothetical protein VaNZ11_005146 [Volvox africanus]|uniref:Uncharacterized protein n=1 Tax=Volvox africanus TaxID=51714 RepID=A0ABQ5RYF1_9CHLO|nr:hypothetical protein VaNZ11_005146 [Volvox africanus]